MVAGAAIASSNTAAATSNAYSSGYAAGSANTSTAYSAGTTTTTATTTQTTYVTGAVYATVPAGAVTINKGGTTYYLSGNTWFKPAYGANGVYYTVVPAP